LVFSLNLNVFSENEPDNRNTIYLNLEYERFGEGNYLSNAINDAISNSIIQPQTLLESELVMSFTYPHSTLGLIPVNVRGEVLSLLFRTPNGTNISGVFVDEPIEYYVIVWNADDDLSINIKNDMSDTILDRFPDATKVSDATVLYNCHSYAWYRQDVENNFIWLQYPNKYFSTEDQTYIKVAEPRVGDVICYVDADALIKEKEIVHSGIIIGHSNDDVSNGICGEANKYIVRSKWDVRGLYDHRGDQCPYVDMNQTSDAEYVEFYRLKTDEQIVMNDNNSFQHSNPINIQAKSANVSRDQTVYTGELCFSYGGIHDITITSDKPLKTALWDVWRESYGLICNESEANGQYIYTYSGFFDADYYYLRAESSNTTESPNISVLISPHQHYYRNYNCSDDSLHAIECDCGEPTYESHSYDQSCLDYNESTHKNHCICGAFAYESHFYTDCTYYSNTKHQESCECGRTKLFDHVFNQESGTGRYKRCLGCEEWIDTQNGSFFPIIKNEELLEEEKQ